MSHPAASPYPSPEGEGVIADDRESIEDGDRVLLISIESS